MLAQVGLEAYILGTLFHYVVKKDAKLEEFRSAMFQCCCAIASVLSLCIIMTVSSTTFAVIVRGVQSAQLCSYSRCRE